MKYEPFHILIAGFGYQAMELLSHQVVAYWPEHPDTVVESSLSHAEMLDLIQDDVDSKF